MPPKKQDAASSSLSGATAATAMKVLPSSTSKQDKATTSKADKEPEPSKKRKASDNHNSNAEEGSAAGGENNKGGNKKKLKRAEDQLKNANGDDGRGPAASSKNNKTGTAASSAAPPDSAKKTPASSSKSSVASSTIKSGKVDLLQKGTTSSRKKSNSSNAGGVRQSVVSSRSSEGTSSSRFFTPGGVDGPASSGAAGLKTKAKGSNRAKSANLDDSMVSAKSDGENDFLNLSVLSSNSKNLNNSAIISSASGAANGAAAQAKNMKFPNSSSLLAPRQNKTNVSKKQASKSLSLSKLEAATARYYEHKKKILKQLADEKRQRASRTKPKADKCKNEAEYVQAYGPKARTAARFAHQMLRRKMREHRENAGYEPQSQSEDEWGLLEEQRERPEKFDNPDKKAQDEDERDDSRKYRFWPIKWCEIPYDEEGPECGEPLEGWEHLPLPPPGTKRLTNDELYQMYRRYYAEWRIRYAKYGERMLRPPARPWEDPQLYDWDWRTFFEHDDVNELECFKLEFEDEFKMPAGLIPERRTWLERKVMEMEDAEKMEEDHRNAMAVQEEASKWMRDACMRKDLAMIRILSGYPLPIMGADKGFDVWGRTQYNDTPIHVLLNDNWGHACCVAKTGPDGVKDTMFKKDKYWDLFASATRERKWNNNPKCNYTSKTLPEYLCVKELLKCNRYHMVNDVDACGRTILHVCALREMEKESDLRTCWLIATAKRFRSLLKKDKLGKRAHDYFWEHGCYDGYVMLKRLAYQKDWGHRILWPDEDEDVGNEEKFDLYFKTQEERVALGLAVRKDDGYHDFSAAAPQVEDDKGLIEENDDEKFQDFDIDRSRAKEAKRIERRRQRKERSEKAKEERKKKSNKYQEVRGEMIKKVVDPNLINVRERWRAKSKEWNLSAKVPTRHDKVCNPAVEQLYRKPYPTLLESWSTTNPRTKEKIKSDVVDLRTEKLIPDNALREKLLSYHEEQREKYEKRKEEKIKSLTKPRTLRERMEGRQILTILPKRDKQRIRIKNAKNLDAKVSAVLQLAEREDINILKWAINDFAKRALKKPPPFPENKPKGFEEGLQHLDWLKNKGGEKILRDAHLKEMNNGLGAGPSLDSEDKYLKVLAEYCGKFDLLKQQDLLQGLELEQVRAEEEREIEMKKVPEILNLESSDKRRRDENDVEMVDVRVTSSAAASCAAGTAAISSAAYMISSSEAASSAKKTMKTSEEAQNEVPAGAPEPATIVDLDNIEIEVEVTGVKPAPIDLTKNVEMMDVDEQVQPSTASKLPETSGVALQQDKTTSTSSKRPFTNFKSAFAPEKEILTPQQLIQHRVDMLNQKRVQFENGEQFIFKDYCRENCFLTPYVDTKLRTFLTNKYFIKNLKYCDHETHPLMQKNLKKEDRGLNNPQIAEVLAYIDTGMVDPRSTEQIERDRQYHLRRLREKKERIENGPKHDVRSVKNLVQEQNRKLQNNITTLVLAHKKMMQGYIPPITMINMSAYDRIWYYTMLEKGQAMVRVKQRDQWRQYRKNQIYALENGLPHPNKVPLKDCDHPLKKKEKDHVIPLRNGKVSSSKKSSKAGTSRSSTSLGAAGDVVMKDAMDVDVAQSPDEMKSATAGAGKKNGKASGDSGKVEKTVIKPMKSKAEINSKTEKTAMLPPKLPPVKGTAMKKDGKKEQDHVVSTSSTAAKKSATQESAAKASNKRKKETK
ncbi:unnamed protein product [Amoebophrya sp. A120]|nr:unnamed protein product [Amoebophrya sp. A120]|eukprot:GSA120T00007407001.1